MKKNNFYLFSYRIGIFYTNYKWAEDLIYEYWNNIPKETIECFIRNKHNCSLYFKNGGFIKSVSATDEAKGSRFDKVIIQNTIDENTINTIICPTLINQVEKVYE